jgi:hypothetical protein
MKEEQLQLNFVIECPDEQEGFVGATPWLEMKIFFWGEGGRNQAQKAEKGSERNWRLQFCLDIVTFVGRSD